jgi:hypothetical protein
VPVLEGEVDALGLDVEGPVAALPALQDEALVEHDRHARC